jgi:hypothetical protein
MNVQGMEFHVALNLMKERRECICPIPAFMDQLQKYEMDCKEKGLIQDDAAKKRKSSSRHQKEEEEVDHEQGSTKKRKATIGPTWPSGGGLSDSVSSSSSKRVQQTVENFGDAMGETNGMDSSKLRSTICSSTRNASMDHGDDETNKQVVDTNTKVSNDKNEVKKATSTTATTSTTTVKSRTRQMGPSLPPGFKRA